jgi:4-hydroxy-tetrahydrodipicolinate synthase
VTPPVSITVALLTPFGADNRVDLEALRAHVEVLVEAGVDGLMPCGTNGEGPLLDEDEAAAVIAATIEAAGGRVRVLAHVGRPSTRATSRLAKRALADGADAVSAVVPYYYGLEPEQMLAHYRALLEAAGRKPAFAYTIPARTGNELPAEVVGTLARNGLAGLKDSTKSFEQHRAYLQATRATDGFAVLMGSDAMVLDALKAGAAGSVSALSNVRPDLLVALKEAFLDGRDDDAAALQEEIAQRREEISRGPAIAGVKQAAAAALAARGIDYPTRLRAPLG